MNRNLSNLALLSFIYVTPAPHRIHYGTGSGYVGHLLF